ncbi:4'-phosphopantetheinyl transferase superfamily protein [Vibrio tapetis subsp. quintayensis]|uniref:4'-phosphopantetheinyl transferase family protein n=1 Tax=Vibrio tapetis TaxID=52443 RepID=UPI0025B5C3B6|nr:4'-phosphopantetheinyl transferase superfamily protein [Vibrio tapetis]MDN3682230.1 4'-phosphopantetheinyl transferase superfamily protein [Vibrio tapetis subsp. quintayensis]
MSSTSTVQLWFCPLTSLDGDTNKVAFLRSRLSDDERIKVDRYRFPKARLKALYVRNYLRVILTRYATTEVGINIAPDQWRFQYESKGKPYLCNEQHGLTGIEFNISHSGEYLLVALVASDPSKRALTGSAAFQLGVDIEKSRAETDIGSIHHHYFSTLESSRLLTLDEADQREHFFDLWALKESYIKAVGKGLAIPLDSFGFDMSRAYDSQTPLNCQEELDVKLKTQAPTKEVTVIQGVTLERQVSDQGKNLQGSVVWFSYLGRLDEEYRFAVTLGISLLVNGAETTPRVEIRANWLCSSQLIQP